MNNTQPEQLSNSYDEFRYHSKPFSFTNIALLEGSTYLLGLNPPAIHKAKVLELGCSFGGNLISQALYHPEAEFVGIDLSESQISQGNEIIKTMGLKNIRLEQKNILDITPEFGQFDYIIVHGIYSWVPDTVKDKIVDIFRTNLTPNGIGYISYNTYPGWKNKDVTRDIMLFTNKYTQHLSLVEQTQRGKAVVKLFSDAIKTLDSEKNRNNFRIFNFDDIQNKDEHYIAHEYLEYHNDPVYINEFVDEVHKHQLAYISDIDLQLSFISWMPKNLREMVNSLSPEDYAVREQCLDYIYDVAFRRSLLCHGELQEQINRTESIPKERLDHLTFINTGKTNDLSRYFDNQNLSQVLQYALLNLGEFSIQTIKDLIENNDEFKSVTLDEVYSGVLYLIIMGVINVYLTPYKIYNFEENKTYVPEQFVKYLQPFVKGNAREYISAGNYYNRETHDLNELQLCLMSNMAKPTTKETLVSELKKFLIENGYKDMDNNGKLIDEEYDAAPLFKALCQSAESLGYVKPYEADVKDKAQSKSKNKRKLKKKK